MTRLILCVTCMAALSLGCGDESTEPVGGGGGTAGAGGMGGSGGSGGSAGSAGMGGTGGSQTVINGCTQADAIDLTGMANVTITDVSAWIVIHSACIRVSAGTIVSWQGNFDIHPLAGGETPIRDEASPISAINATSGTMDAVVSLDTAGTYPYFCEIHLQTMEGVIYVE